MQGISVSLSLDHESDSGTRRGHSPWGVGLRLKEQGACAKVLASLQGWRLLSELSLQPGLGQAEVRSELLCSVSQTIFVRLLFDSIYFSVVLSWCLAKSFKSAVQRGPGRHLWPPPVPLVATAARPRHLRCLPKGSGPQSPPRGHFGNLCV